MSIGLTDVLWWVQEVRIMKVITMVVLGFIRTHSFKREYKLIISVLIIYDHFAYKHDQH